MKDIKKQLTIWYNPECSKCRDAKDIAGQANCDIKIREYLQEAPQRAELETLLQQLGLQAEDLVRKNEPLFQEQYKNRSLNQEEWLEILLAHPQLMERPIIIYGNKAIIGRPPSRVLDLLQGE